METLGSALQHFVLITIFFFFWGGGRGCTPHSPVKVQARLTHVRLFIPYSSCSLVRFGWILLIRSDQNFALCFLRIGSLSYFCIYSTAAWLEC